MATSLCATTSVTIPTNTTRFDFTSGATVIVTPSGGSSQTFTSSGSTITTNVGTLINWSATMPGYVAKSGSITTTTTPSPNVVTITFDSGSTSGCFGVYSIETLYNGVPVTSVKQGDTVTIRVTFINSGAAASPSGLTYSITTSGGAGGGTGALPSGIAPGATHPVTFSFVVPSDISSIQCCANVIGQSGWTACGI